MRLLVPAALDSAAVLPATEGRVEGQDLAPDRLQQAARKQLTWSLQELLRSFELGAACWLAAMREPAVQYDHLQLCVEQMNPDTVTALVGGFGAARVG